MTIEVKIAHLNIPSTEHRAQDAWHYYSFEHKGKKVYVGAVSDGCSGGLTGLYDKNWHPELGAKWLVENFCQIAEELYKQKWRRRKLIRETALSLCLQMKLYKPQNPKTDFFETKEFNISNELLATLYGFVLDDNGLSLLCAGNGCLMCNGKVWTVKQADKDLYPMLLLAFPEDCWFEVLEDVFSIDYTVFKATDVENFAISTDGITEINEIYEKFANDPERLVKEISLFNDTNVADEKVFDDDATIISISIKQDKFNDLPFNLDNLAFCANQNSLEYFTEKLKYYRENIQKGEKTNG